MARIREIPKASTHATNLLLNNFKQAVRCEVQGQQDDFGEPRRNREARLRSGVHLDARVRYHSQRDLLMRGYVDSLS